jgi:hypothetical protein
MTNGTIKIRFEMADPRYLPGISKPKPGHCKRCGGLLTAKDSQRVGYGHKCFKNIPIMMILKIPGEKRS